MTPLEPATSRAAGGAHGRALDAPPASIDPASSPELSSRKFAAEAGTLNAHGMEYARMQVLSGSELLDGKRFHTPSIVGRGSDQLVLSGGG